jgi:hypothetical protein
MVISSLGFVGGDAPLVNAVTESPVSSGASAGIDVRPVGVTLRAKGYNAQEENAQVFQMKPSIHLSPKIRPDSC